jgi:flagellum-specific peptidoglycan hydrolase FlgJ
LKKLAYICIFIAFLLIPLATKESLTEGLKQRIMILFTGQLTPAQTFIQNSSDAVLNSCKGTDLFPSVCMAQMCLESGWGKYLSGGNNYFGVKATGGRTAYWNGESTKCDTTEVINGKEIRINDGFRKYQNMEQSIRDRNHLLIANKRYINAIKAKTPEQQIEEIWKAGYATDPDYVQKILSIIRKYELKRLDYAEQI